MSRLDETTESAGDETPAGEPWWLPLAAAVQFLTVVPAAGGRALSSRSIGAATGWFPLVGLGLGVLLLGVAGLVNGLWSPFLDGAVVLVLWVLATGALHLDGALDWFDGVLGGRSRESRLKILRDQRVGAFGVVGGALLLLMKAGVLSIVMAGPGPGLLGLILAPVVGRWLMLLAIWRYPYAREDGLGATMHRKCGQREAMIGSAIGVGVVLVFGVGWGIVAAGAALLIGWGLVWLTMRRLGGLTGDGYGLLCEVGELAVLMVWVLPW